MGLKRVLISSVGTHPFMMLIHEIVVQKRNLGLGLGVGPEVDEEVVASETHVFDLRCVSVAVETNMTTVMTLRMMTKMKTIFNHHMCTFNPPTYLLNQLNHLLLLYRLACYL